MSEKKVSWKMRRGLGFLWKNMDMNMTGLIRKNGVHAERVVQGGSNMTGTDYTLFTHKSFPVIFEPPCIFET
jgi:hypothetical protein